MIHLIFLWPDWMKFHMKLKRLKLRKNNWESDTFEFDEVLTEFSSQKRVYEVVAKPVVEVYEPLTFCPSYLLEYNLVILSAVYGITLSPFLLSMVSGIDISLFFYRSKKQHIFVCCMFSPHLALIFTLINILTKIANYFWFRCWTRNGI
jgi:hypothetical protein